MWMVYFSSCIIAEWEERWVQSTHKSDYGAFKWTAGKFYGDEEKDKGKECWSKFRQDILMMC